MTRRLPPLNAIRAFDSSAKYENFTKAAAELHVTPSAISRHVTLLESRLGVKLFSRRQRRISLTDKGRSYAAAVKLVFDQLESATRQISDRSAERELRIKLLPTVALRWFLPRVVQFQANHPEFMIQVSTTMETVDLVAGEADITVWNGFAPPDDLVSHWLFDEELVPVCAPGYIYPNRGARARKALERKTLLSAFSRPKDWQEWFAGAGLTEPEGVVNLGFQYSFLAYEAAIAGGGIAIAVRELVKQELSQGTLIIPFGPAVRTSRSYFLVSTTSGATRPAVRALLEWAKPGQPVTSPLPVPIT